MSVGGGGRHGQRTPGLFKVAGLLCDGPKIASYPQESPRNPAVLGGSEKAS